MSPFAWWLSFCCILLPIASRLLGKIFCSLLQCLVLYVSMYNIRVCIILPGILFESFIKMSILCVCTSTFSRPLWPSPRISSTRPNSTFILGFFSRFPHFGCVDKPANMVLGWEGGGCMFVVAEDTCTFLCNNIKIERRPVLVDSSWRDRFYTNYSFSRVLVVVVCLTGECRASHSTE